MPIGSIDICEGNSVKWRNPPGREQRYYSLFSPRMKHGDAAVIKRSEEHTSELQSLMRISYAVFCLKKKKTNNTTTHCTRPFTHLTNHHAESTLTNDTLTKIFKQ